MTAERTRNTRTRRGFTRLACDVLDCHTTAIDGDDAGAARATARELGWTRAYGRDLCPVHRDEPMMTAEHTPPAIERAAMAGGGAWARGMQDAHVPHLWRHIAVETITAALSDPDDPEFLARTLYVLSRSAHGWITNAQAFGNAPKDVQVHWRAVADGLRTMLTGQGS